MSVPETAGVLRPAALNLHASGELRERVERAAEILQDYALCGRQCHVDRTRSVKGAGCRTGIRARVDEFRISHDIERCLIGPGGAGMVEFSYCNLRCRTCSESEVRQRGRGDEMDAAEIADGMMRLQDAGADVLVLHRPSHVIAQSLAAIEIALDRGLRLPIAYDTGGYDHPTGLVLLDGVVDLYVTELKFGNSGAGRQVSRVRDYASKSRKALSEMHRQVGDLVIDPDGRARRGLLVRHRVLPNGLAHSGPVLRFLAEQLSTETALNLLDGFTPVYQSSDLPMLRRELQASEFERVQSLADRYGLHRHVH